MAGDPQSVFNKWVGKPISEWPEELQPKTNFDFDLIRLGGESYYLSARISGANSPEGMGVDVNEWYDIIRVDAAKWRAAREPKAAPPVKPGPKTDPPVPAKPKTPVAKPKPPDKPPVKIWEGPVWGKIGGTPWPPPQTEPKRVPYDSKPNDSWAKALDSVKPGGSALGGFGKASGNAGKK